MCDFENGLCSCTQVTTDWDDTLVLCFQRCVTLRTACVATHKQPRTPWTGSTPQELQVLVPTLTTPTWHAQVWLSSRCLLHFTHVHYVYSYLHCSRVYELSGWCKPELAYNYDLLTCCLLDLACMRCLAGAVYIQYTSAVLLGQVRSGVYEESNR